MASLFASSNAFSKAKKTTELPCPSNELSVIMLSHVPAPFLYAKMLEGNNNML